MDSAPLIIGILLKILNMPPNTITGTTSMTSETTRARTGKWYWADLDPALKDEKSIDIPVGSGSKLRLESFDLRQKAKQYL